MVKNNDYYRKEASVLQKLIAEARFFLSQHKPSIGFWGEYLLRGFLRTNLSEDIKVGQGFIWLNEDTKSTFPTLCCPISEKMVGMEHIFQNTISTQCDIIVYTGEPVKTFGEIDVVCSKDVIAVIEVKCSISIKTLEKTIDAFQKLNEMGIKSKYLFIYNSCSMKTIMSHIYTKVKNDKIKNLWISDEQVEIFDHGDECYLPTAVIGVSNNYFLCQDYVISNRDQFGYVAYELRDDIEKLSCLQLFLSHLLGNIDSSIKGSNGFKMNFESMINKYSFVLYDL